MDFSFSEEQTDIRNLAQQIFNDYCKPERLKKLEQAGEYFDRELWTALCKAGLSGVAIDEAQGGMGYDFESLCILLEEAGRSVAKVALIPVLVGSALPVQKFASAQRKQQLLPGLASGEKLLTWARIEPGNSDALRPSMIARSEGDEWLLSGRKHCVPLAELADHILLAARTEAGDVLIVLVDRTQKGLSVQPQVVTSGETYFDLEFDALRISDVQILARGATAEQWLVYTERRYQTALCAMAVGLCDRMMRMTASYTSEREQFGRAVATFQAVGHRMADCFKDVECLRLTTQQAIFQLNVESESVEDAVTVAKIWCGDVCHRVSQAAQHCHGGIGVDRDYSLFRYCLMARQIELTAGSTAALTQALGDKIAERAKSAA